MKSFSINFFWIFIPLLCSFSSCMNTIEPDPSGGGLLTCKVMGESFIPKSDDFKRLAKQASIINDTLTITGIYNIGDRQESVGIRVENFSGTGTYELYSREENYGRYSLGYVQAYTDTWYTGEIVVTHYIREKGIVAGTFHFTAHHPATGNTYQITDGKFDMRYSIR